MNHHFTRILALLAPISVALLIVILADQFKTPDRWVQPLEVIRISNTKQLEQYFATLAYQWPPSTGQTVPRIAIDPLPKDFNRLVDVERKKSLFFMALLPIVLAENARIMAQRSKLISMLNERMPAFTTTDGRWLLKLLRDYKIKGDYTDQFIRDKLLLRLDEIPVELVLAQAANESGWGTSRFAIQGNNLFGLWTYRKGMGIMPVARAGDQQHTVRAFPSVRAAVRAYLHNINIGRAYNKLWRLRAAMRESGQALDGLQLAEGLLPYSARGEDYVNEIRQLITSNRLDLLSGVELQLDF